MIMFGSAFGVGDMVRTNSRLGLIIEKKERIVEAGSVSISRIYFYILWSSSGNSNNKVRSYSEGLLTSLVVEVIRCGSR